MRRTAYPVGLLLALTLTLGACDSANPDLTALSDPAAARGGPERSAVCHIGDGGTVKRLVLPAPAVRAHLRHGDALPGTGGYDADCQRDGGVPALEIRAETITAGLVHTCGLDGGGDAYCWGENTHGQLGDGTVVFRAEPMAVQMPPGVRFAAIEAGVFHTVALSSTGEAYAWGLNTYGQLGDGTNSTRRTPVAVAMPDGVRFVSISAGGVHTVALDASGAAWAWGLGGAGQLGTGTYLGSTTPVPVQMPGGVRFTAVSAGDEHAVALATTGEAYAWGRNNSGQLGRGSGGHSTAPVPVVMPAGVRFASISAGYFHSAALAATGEGYAWGGGARGELGDGSFNSSTTPVAVAMPAGVAFSAITAGSEFTVALEASGAAYAWGRNNRGQLGEGTLGIFNAPVAVQMPAGIGFTSVSAGGTHAVAVASTGAAYAWGGNQYGQLGDGTTDTRPTPVAVSGGVSFQP